MERFAVWALGADRPGIVAAVTGSLLAKSCNLEDCSMTILADQFAMVLIVDAPTATSAQELESALSGPAQEFDLGISVRWIGAPASTLPFAGDPYVVSVFGADRPGIVHDIAAALASLNVNVTNLETRVVGEDPEPIYAMVLEVLVLGGLAESTLAERLCEVGAELGVDVRVHAAASDIL